MKTNKHSETNYSKYIRDLREAKAGAKWVKVDSYKDLTLEEFEWDARLRLKLKNKIVAENCYNTVLVYKNLFAVTDYFSGTFPTHKILTYGTLSTDSQ